jgi:hypothetical protein
MLDDDFEMFLASKEDHSNQKLERNNLTIQLTLYPLYSENQERLPRESNEIQRIEVLVQLNAYAT